MCTCHIIPEDVLRRLSEDKRVPSDVRDAAARTATVDVEFRKLRTQALRLSRAAEMVGLAPSPTGIAATPWKMPATPIYDCGHRQTLPGTAVTSPGTSADATVKHVYAETRSLATFYNQVFKRNSVDNAGMALQSSIHYGSKYNNAFWNGSQMTYGDGDGSIFVDFSKGNDVIGHELTHGVTQHTLQLEYSGDAGGLNESLSDCFGSMFRQWEAGQDVTQADWLIGKDIMGPMAISQGYTCLRDMADPAAKHCLAPQPTRYADITPGMDPHYSSGPPNLAFCTACVTAGGKSWEAVGQVWYAVMTGMGAKPKLKMKDFANRTRSVAGTLFAGQPAVAAAVDAGWKRVGL